MVRKIEKKIEENRKKGRQEFIPIIPGNIVNYETIRKFLQVGL